MKRPFKFYLPDGSVETNTNTDYLLSLGMDQEYIAERQKQHEAHLNSEMYNERIWRNRQLKDCMHLRALDLSIDVNKSVDNYIEKLKSYDLKYQQRPIADDLLLENMKGYQDWLIT